jgi:mannitol-1-phosphate/altronate dehydrogenase
MVRTILANDSLWGLDLTTLPGMTDAVAAGLQAILTDGMRKATESVLSNTRV